MSFTHTNANKSLLFEIGRAIHAKIEKLNLEYIELDDQDDRLGLLIYLYVVKLNDEPNLTSEILDIKELIEDVLPIFKDLATKPIVIMMHPLIYYGGVRTIQVQNMMVPQVGILTLVRDDAKLFYYDIIPHKLISPYTFETITSYVTRMVNIIL